jgi:hypothetical protein
MVISGCALQTQELDIESHVAPHTQEGICSQTPFASKVPDGHPQLLPFHSDPDKKEQSGKAQAPTSTGHPVS